MGSVSRICARETRLIKVEGVHASHEETSMHLLLLAQALPAQLQMHDTITTTTPAP